MLLPFVEQTPTWDEFMSNHLGQRVPWNTDQLTRTKIETFICPSDAKGNTCRADQKQPTSYHCNRGD